MRAAIGLAIALAVLPGEAVVAQKLGSILPDRSAEQTERNISGFDRARQTMNSYAVCLARTRLIALRKAVSSSTDELKDQAIARLSSDDCLKTGDLRMPSQLLRGAVYRALYIRDFGNVPAIPAAAAEASPSASPLQAFGECVDRIDPANVRDLVLSTPATPVEERALTALGPTFSRCITPGEQIRFNRALLQSVLVEAAYRQAAATHSVNK